ERQVVDAVDIELVRDVEVRDAVVELRLPRVDEEPGVAACAVRPKRAPALIFRAQVLRPRQRVVEVELVSRAVILAYAQNERVVVGPPDRAQCGERSDADTS